MKIEIKAMQSNR